jgi:putative proteasome-type protease
MTYCLGIILPEGLVLASDSRSNAGVDQIVRVSKLTLMCDCAERVIVVQSQGNLATTQSVVTMLREALGSGDQVRDLETARTMFEVATMVGGQLRDVSARDGKFVQAYGSVSASFLVGGQIAGEPPRLFQIYSAGNFVEASERSPFLQIGETKYGKPILDRQLTARSTLDEAAKLALLSFDATVRSNLSVGLPIDVLVYRTGSFSAKALVTVDDDNPYWSALQRDYSQGLAALVAGLPAPPASWESP